MKTKFVFSAIVIFMLISTAFAQEKSKAEIKGEKKIEQQKMVEALVTSKVFLFAARTANPIGSRSVNLNQNENHVIFHPEMIDSDMPFFGRAYSGMAYGGDGGYKFQGKPEEFTVTQKKKNYQIDVRVISDNKLYRLSLSVTFSGTATLSITSDSRSTISYQGDIFAIEKPDEKK